MSIIYFRLKFTLKKIIPDSKMSPDFSYFKGIHYRFSPDSESWMRETKLGRFCFGLTNLRANGKTNPAPNFPHSWISFIENLAWVIRVQRKPFLPLAIQANWRKHLLAETSFQLAPKAFWLTEFISQFFCYSNSSKNLTCPSGKLKTEFTSPVAKSTSPGLSDSTFFARWLYLRAT